MATENELNFVAASKISIAMMQAEILQAEAVGYDVEDKKTGWFLASMFLEQIDFFVNLPQEDKLCLSAEEICDMVRKLKDFLFSC